MATIKERAKEFRIQKENEYGCTDLIGLEKGYIQGATEQDRIARKEERERCIKSAQEWYCKDRCAGYNACKSKYQGKCSMTENIRKAMEGEL